MKKNQNNLDIIGMAWSDKISFEEIKKKTGLLEKDVISLMRKTLKKKAIYYGVNALEENQESTES